MTEQYDVTESESTLNDAHCHFFSTGFFTTLAADPLAARPDSTGNPAIDLPMVLGWEPPGTDEALADRWVTELNRQGVTRAALMSSVPDDEISVATAVKRHPNRFVGMFMVDPSTGDGTARATQAFNNKQLHCACLFPAMHGYRLDDDCVVDIFEAAAAHSGSIFVHCGVLSVGVRKKLGLVSRFDIRLGDPLALVPVASAFPSVPVLIPHFGAGFFRELLMAADLCPSFHIDTSSSNSWMKYIPKLELTAVFRQVLDILGPTRILFGSDSSFFPRGWQRQLLIDQLAIMNELGISTTDRKAIFSDNFDRFFGSGCS